MAIIFAVASQKPRDRKRKNWKQRPGPKDGTTASPPAVPAKTAPPSKDQKPSGK